MNLRTLTAALGTPSLREGLVASTYIAAITLAATAFAEPVDTHAAPPPEIVPPIEQGLVPLIVALVVFTLLFAVLSAVVWPKITQGLKDRENKVRAENESADAARREAREALEQYQRSLADARAEAQKMLEQARQQQATLAAELHAKADAELGAMRDQARQDIDKAKKLAMAEIHSLAGDLGVTIAGKVLNRPVPAGNAQAILEASVAQMAGSAR